MDDIFYIIKNGKNEVVFTNLVKNTNSFQELKNCTHLEKKKVDGKERYQTYLEIDGFSIYICSYNLKLSRKMFLGYSQAFAISFRLFNMELKKAKDLQQKNIKRLKHNISTHNANISQEIYSIIPQDRETKDVKEQYESIKKYVSKNIESVPSAFLHILKNSNLIKSEFDVNEMLGGENPDLDFENHPIHKIVLLTLNPFWADIVSSNVKINLGKCTEIVKIDYRTISVVFTHIFDNICKYIQPYSELNILFKDEGNYFCICLQMSSLQVTNTDLENIFQEGYSGENSIKYDLNGHGIGMYVVKKLIELNHGTIEFLNNVTKRGTPVLYQNLPYEQNQINIRLLKN